jgi:hypothetical protein
VTKKFILRAFYWNYLQFLFFHLEWHHQLLLIGRIVHWSWSTFVSSYLRGPAILILLQFIFYCPAWSNWLYKYLCCAVFLHGSNIRLIHIDNCNPCFKLKKLVLKFIINICVIICVIIITILSTRKLKNVKQKFIIKGTKNCPIQLKS